MVCFPGCQSLKKVSIKAFKSKMNIVFFTHPGFNSHQSMPRFAAMLAGGMKERGHTVQLWTAKPAFVNLPVPASIKKWMGYIDQFILFPLSAGRRIRRCPADTLFVYCDQALGPWVPLTSNRPHVIHCHDFLAQSSALGLIPEAHLSWTGRAYQAFIRRGYSKGRNFISVSENTEEDLYKFHKSSPVISEVVYNGLNRAFSPGNADEARIKLSNETGIDMKAGYLLHVGGNQWYKNRVGVIEIYNAWRSRSAEKLPLLMIGYKPSYKLVSMHHTSPYKEDIHMLEGKSDEFVELAYRGASVFLFPSLAEGFGWPVAEAMACGTPVITTGEKPMSEVAASAGFLIGRRPTDPESVASWADEAGAFVEHVINFSPAERAAAIEAGLDNVKRFDTKHSLDKVEELYNKILHTY